MVAEADESDRSFLKLLPTIAVITNIDHEHLENYGSFDDLQQAFVDFANKVPFYGAVVACAGRSRICAAAAAADDAAVTTYGLDDAQSAGRRRDAMRRCGSVRLALHGAPSARSDAPMRRTTRSARCSCTCPAGTTC